MDLRTSMLKNAIYDLLKSKDIRGGVADTVNRYGFPVLEIRLDQAQPNTLDEVTALLMRVAECDPAREPDEWNDIQAKAREVLTKAGALACPECGARRMYVEADPALEEFGASGGGRYRTIHMPDCSANT
jgi:hypothetical protein